jgi:uncharacterized lipoprotein YehR (DUF1307 family)
MSKQTLSDVLKVIAVLIATAIIVSLSSCTDNQRARSFGGTEYITLDKGERMVNITWKKDHLWILTKQDTTKPTTYTFREKSSFGVLDGEIVVIEQ